MRKLVALVVVLAMVLSSMSFAFAAAPSDVAGTSSEGAVTRLMGLGIITGYDDGTFKPDNTITRAEFCAIVIRGLGLDAAAKAGTGTAFSDVPSSHWASGYVAMASGLGIVTGYGNGKFGPSDLVTYDQAVTMVVRAMGYDPLAKKLGGFPAGYLVVASNEEVTTGLNGTVGAPASRGLVARIMDKALDKDFYGIDAVSEDGKATYKKQAGTTFLSKMGYEKDGAATIVIETKSVNDALKANKFIITGGTEKEATSAVDVESLLGKKVQLWKNNDGKIAFAEVKTAAADMVAVKEIKSITYVGGVATKIKVKNTADVETEYDIVAGSKAVLNMVAATLANAITAVNTTEPADATDATIEIAKENYKITLTLNDSKVAFANVMKFENPVKVGSEPVINTVSKITRINSNIELQNGDDKVLSYTIVKTDGTVLQPADVKKNTVITVAKDLGAAGIKDDRYYIIVSDKTVQGKMTATYGTGPDAYTKVKIDGTNYSFKVAQGLNSTAIDNTVKIFVDKDDKIVHIEKVSGDDPDKYGVVVGSSVETTLGDTVRKVKMFNAAGDKVVYELTSTAKDVAAAADFDNDSTTGENDDLTNALVKYFVNADGKISNMVIATAADRTAVGTPSSIDVGKLKIGNKYIKNSDVALFDVNGTTYSSYKWSAMSDEAGLTVREAILKDDEIVAILFTAASIDSDKKYAIVTDKYAVKDSKTQLEMKGAGAEAITVKGLTSTANMNDVAKAKVVWYTLLSSGEIGSIDDVTSVVYSQLTSVTDTRIKVKDITNDPSTGEKYFYFTDKTIILFDAGTGDMPNGDDVAAMTKAELYKDMIVRVYLKDGTTDEIAVLVVTKK